MAVSTISLLPTSPGTRAPGPDAGRNRRLSAALEPAFRQALGRELRERRRARAMSQQALGAPLTRAYVSAVETGRTIPSLAALEHMTARLEVPLSVFFDAVERRRSSED